MKAFLPDQIQIFTGQSIYDEYTTLKFKNVAENGMQAVPNWPISRLQSQQDFWITRDTIIPGASEARAGSTLPCRSVSKNSVNIYHPKIEKFNIENSFELRWLIVCSGNVCTWYCIMNYKFYNEIRRTPMWVNIFLWNA